MNPLDPKLHEPVIADINKIGAERNVINCILHNTDLIFDATTNLQPVDFSNDINRTIYSIMIELMNKSVKISDSSIIANMKKYGTLSPEDVEAYISTIYKANPASIDYKYNIQLIKRASVKRQAYQETLQIQRECTNDDYTDSVEEFLGKQENRFLDLSIKAQSADNVVVVNEAIDSYLEKYKMVCSEVPGLRFGLPQLDLELGGARGGRLIIIGARNKTGKSVLTLNFTRNFVLLEKAPILYIDTEMTTEQVVPRLLGSMTGVPATSIEKGLYIKNPDWVDRVDEARERLRKSGSFFHVTMPNFTVEKVSAVIRKYYNQYGIKAVIFDYIKLSQSDDLRARQDLILGKTCQVLKDLATILDIPIISPCQMNRQGIETEELHEGMIKGSDEIGYYCDHLLMLRNKTQKEFEDEKERGEDYHGNQVLQMVLSRHGGDYEGHLDFQRDICSYVEMVNMAKQKPNRTQIKIT